MDVGVNYTPRVGWFHSWLDLDLDAVRADLAQLAELGLDHVRIFPLWPLLQPNRGLIRGRAIEDVREVCLAAGEVDLAVSVDVLNGHLSSFDFLPSWVTSWHQRDLFRDPEVRSGQRDLARELAAALADVAAVSGLTLGNEFGQFAASRHPQASTPTVDEVNTWLGDMFAEVAEVLPKGRHHHGFDDDLWFVDEHPFTPRHATTFGASTTVHAWVFTPPFRHLGPGHPDLVQVPRFLLELAAAWSHAPYRRIWLQEVGAPRSHVPDDAVAGFVADVAMSVRDMPDLDAVTWWCSHDVSRSMLDFPELEYSLGLFDEEGRAKPEALVLRDLLPDLRAAEADRGPRPALVIDGDWGTGEGRSTAGGSGGVVDSWLAMRREGLRPALVHRDRLGDSVYLAARGISEVSDA